MGTLGSDFLNNGYAVRVKVIGKRFKSRFADPVARALRPAVRIAAPSHRFEPIKAADVTAAFMIAKSAEAAAIAERDKIEKAAKRKYRWAAADRADKQAHKQLSDIEDRIADTPADGLNGILVKLAVWRFWNDLDDGSEHFAVLSAYETLVKMTGGVDLAAEVERW